MTLFVLYSLSNDIFIERKFTLVQKTSMDHKYFHYTIKNIQSQVNNKWILDGIIKKMYDYENNPIDFPVNQFFVKSKTELKRIM